MTAADSGPAAAPTIGLQGNISAETVNLQLAAGGGTAPPGRRFQSNIAARRGLPFLGRDDLLDRIAKSLGDPHTDNVVVLHGPPGVGKSELAREYGRRHGDRYPGGTFFINFSSDTMAIDLAKIGRTCLGIDFPPDLPISDQALRTLYSLGQLPWLLILDNPQSEEAARPWLPLAGMPCHVVITTILDRWDASWSTLHVEPLPDAVSLDLVEKLAGPDVAKRHGDHIVERAGGLPVQLVPQSITLARAARRGRDDSFIGGLAQETLQSFTGVYHLIDREAHLLLHAAARLNTQRIIATELAAQLAEGAGWSKSEFERHLDTCLDVHVLEGTSELHMHRLFGAFVRESDPTPEIAGLLTLVIRAQARRMVDIATEVAAAPNRADLASILMTYPLDCGSWSDPDGGLSVSDWSRIGLALSEIGNFSAARPWLERAVAENQERVNRGEIDHQTFGTALHLMGYCLVWTGDFTAARACYERAVAEREKGDFQGRVNHDSLGSSLYQMGKCLTGSGEFAEARPWFERAASEKEKGDVQGQVDFAGLGMCLHQVGYCLCNTGELTVARASFERAVAEKEKGDVQGRVDHDSIGSSLHQVGYCLASTGEWAAAHSWFERAAAEIEKGDVHGRVNHQVLGEALDHVGICLVNAQEFDAARASFERAIAEKEKGDVHGRIDHDSLSSTVHQVGYCLAIAGEWAGAHSWFERAIAEANKGDIHGRVNHDGLGRTMHEIACCLARSGEFTAALVWFERAIAETEKGDVHGRVDHGSVGLILHEAGHVLVTMEQFTDARGRFERAISEKQKGDIHGRIDRQSLDRSRQALEDCLREAADRLM